MKQSCHDSFGMPPPIFIYMKETSTFKVIIIIFGISAIAVTSSWYTKGLSSGMGGSGWLMGKMLFVPAKGESYFPILAISCFMPWGMVMWGRNALGCQSLLMITKKRSREIQSNYPEPWHHQNAELTLEPPTPDFLCKIITSLII